MIQVYQIDIKWIIGNIWHDINYVQVAYTLNSQSIVFCLKLDFILVFSIFGIFVTALRKEKNKREYNIIDSDKSIYNCIVFSIIQFSIAH